MASIANPVSSLCSIPIKALPSSFGVETRFLVTRAASSSSPEKRVAPVAGGFSGIELCAYRLRRTAMRSAGGGSDGGEAEVAGKKKVKKPNSFSHRYIDMLDKLHTVTYLCSWFIMAFIYICWFGIIRYLLSSVFSILTKELYNYFPFPYFVSVIHLLVGIAYWFVIQSVDLPLGPSPKDAVAKVGLWKLLFDVFRTGLFSHVYYRFVATDTNAEKDGPRLHAVGNVLQRGFGIGLSIAVFGNGISTLTGIGTGIALAGVAIYNLTKAKIVTKEEAADCAAAWEMKKDLAKRNARKNSK